jgi:hypothetical protein
LKLIKRPPSWNEMHSLDETRVKRRTWDELAYAEWNKTRAALSLTMTSLVEVKTSRADFRGDRKWKAPLPVDLAFLAVPKGMITPEEWPEGWGILEFDGKCMKRTKTPTPATATVEQQRDVILIIAIRRDHHTWYERWREVQIVQRIDRAEEKTVSRVADVARAVLQIARGEKGTIEEALRFNRVTKEMPWWAMNQLRELWNIQPVAPTE